jgi:hypothetical protein
VGEREKEGGGREIVREGGIEGWMDGGIDR